MCPLVLARGRVGESESELEEKSADERENQSREHSQNAHIREAGRARFLPLAGEAVFWGIVVVSAHLHSSDQVASSWLLTLAVSAACMLPLGIAGLAWAVWCVMPIDLIHLRRHNAWLAVYLLVVVVELSIGMTVVFQLHVAVGGEEGAQARAQPRQVREQGHGAAGENDPQQHCVVVLAETQIEDRIGEFARGLQRRRTPAAPGCARHRHPVAAPAWT
jgi:hypothetical protein